MISLKYTLPARSTVGPSMKVVVAAISASCAATNDVTVQDDSRAADARRPTWRDVTCPPFRDGCPSSQIAFRCGPSLHRLRPQIVPPPLLEYRPQDRSGV